MHAACLTYVWELSLVLMTEEVGSLVIRAFSLSCVYNSSSLVITRLNNFNKLITTLKLWLRHILALNLTVCDQVQSWRSEVPLCLLLIATTTNIMQLVSDAVLIR